MKPTPVTSFFLHGDSLPMKNPIRLLLVHCGLLLLFGVVLASSGHAVLASARIPDDQGTPDAGALPLLPTTS